MRYYDRKNYSPTTSFRLPEKTLNEFGQKAKALRMTKAELLRYLIKSFLRGEIQITR